MANQLYKTTSLLTALLFFVLSLTLLIWPDIIFNIFELEQSLEAVVIARRAACLFLGLAVIVFLLRSTASRQAQEAISAGIALSMAALACLGIAEFLLGHIGPGIFLAIGTEVLITSAYGYALYKSRYA